MDEASVEPRKDLIADLLLVASNNYVDLNALQGRFAADVRTLFSLSNEALQVQRDAESLREAEFEAELGIRKRALSPTDNQRSDASTPCSSAGGSRHKRSRTDSPGPPEDSDPDEGPELGEVEMNPLVANHLQGNGLATAARAGGIRLIARDLTEGDGAAAGQRVVLLDNRTNSTGSKWWKVRLLADAKDTPQWVRAVHVAPLPSCARRDDPARRRLLPVMGDSPASPAASPPGWSRGRDDRTGGGERRNGDVGHKTGRQTSTDNHVADRWQSLEEPPQVLPPIISARHFSHALLPTATGLPSASASDALRRLPGTGSERPRRNTAAEIGAEVTTSAPNREVCLRKSWVPPDDTPL